MKTKTTILYLLIVAGIMSSCGPGKKLTAANKQVEDLEATVANLKIKVADLEGKNKAANDQFNAQTTEYNNYKKECQEKEQELARILAVRQEFADNMAKLIEKLETAQAEFKDQGVDIYPKDGVVYVDMQDNLLYKSGSAALSADGKKALGNLASVLNEYPDLKVIVVGNTDSVKPKKGSDNWSLSTERANGVVRILRDSYQVDPTRLMASGKGKYNPIADNSTADGRAKNRRIEIVLNPNWRKLWEAVKKD